MLLNTYRTPPFPSARSQAQGDDARLPAVSAFCFCLPRWSVEKEEVGGRRPEGVA